MERGDQYKTMSDDDSVEAFELLKLKDKIQCAHCHKYATAGFGRV